MSERTAEIPEHATNPKESPHRLRQCLFVHFLTHVKSDPVADAVQWILSDPSFIRVSIATQFNSQVFPPSSENDCSKRHEVGVMSEIMNRTKIARPFNVS